MVHRPVPYEHTPFCDDCPDREACLHGVPCTTVRSTDVTLTRLDANGRPDTTSASVKVPVTSVAFSPGGYVSSSSGVFTMPTTPSSPPPRVEPPVDVGPDVVQRITTTLPVSAGAEERNRVLAESREIAHDYANRYGYDIIDVDTFSELRRDPFEVEMTTEVRYRPRHDGIWGDIRAALVQDAQDLAEQRRVERTKHSVGDVHLDYLASEAFVWNGEHWVPLR